MSYTFKKHERLKRKRYFDAIFSHGKSIKAFPIRVIYLPFKEENFLKTTDLPENTQVAFSVPKRRFKHAVDRNRIKRQMLEAYRLNKSLLGEPHAIVFVYLSNKKMSYRAIELAMQSLLNSLNNVS